MLVGYDRNPNLTIEQKLQSLIESIQMALNDASGKLSDISRRLDRLGAKEPDSEMSDTSDNVVQNKVIKQYVDTATALDTAISGTSTRPVQNNVIKGYVDTQISDAKDYVDDGLALKENLLQVTEPTISISATVGTLKGATIRKYGHVVQLFLDIRNSNTVASGASVFEGIINTENLRPAVQVHGGSFYGQSSLQGAIGISGTIVIRNASSTSVSMYDDERNHAVISFTYIVE